MSCFARHQREAEELRKELECNSDCVDFDKPCVLRNHIQSPYCYYKKRKEKASLTIGEK